LHGDAEHRVEVQLGAQSPRDRRDEPFALERLRERCGRAGPVERGCGLRRQRLEQGELLAGEGAPHIRRREGEHCDHALLRHERHERRALRADRVDEPPAHLRRAFDVEDGHRCDLEDGARDA
jgi:hypothetical protein